MLRLDAALVARGLVPSREKAKQAIHSAQVLLNNTPCLKPAQSVLDSDTLTCCAVFPYVSRGGEKLQKAIEQFSLAFTGLVCADIGASTGGFTDCMLRHGAAKVYAVDVGNDQLAPSLREDSRVINLENTNIRDLTAFDQPISFCSVDVSFISLTYVLPIVYNLTAPDAACICLIKPQFEAGKQNLNKKGVVKDRKVHLAVCQKILAFAAQLGFDPAGLTYSPLKGPEGNLEYLLYLRKEKKPHPPIDLDSTIAQSHLL